MEYLYRIGDRVMRFLDSQRGVDFLSIGSPVDVRPSSLATRSSPSGGYHLWRVLRTLDIKRGQSMLDVGCGKGSAIRTMRRFPLSRIDGLEISDSLAREARANLARLNGKTLVHHEIYSDDARQFSRWHEYDYIYMYNPFPTEVMMPVAAAIATGSRRKRTKAPTTVIYNNPICYQALADADFKMVGDFPARHGNRIHVYELDPSGSPNQPLGGPP